MTLTAAALTLGKNVRRLTVQVIEHLHDPSLMADPALEASVELILDRLCLSTQLSKPVGLATWAIREARRIGVARTLELADAAAHAVANEAALMDVDQGRLLAFLDLMRAEIHSAVSGLNNESITPAKTQTETTQALLAMLGERDAGTCSHSKATAEWARRLCAAMGLPRAQSEFVELCAVVHDIGQVATPDRILFKPGPLTSDEWEVVREHCAAGQRILNQIPSLSRCGVTIRAHHERWDGLGYPDGLAGENIPYEARILAVVDSFHAMISDRPYRRAIAPRRALEILQSGKGTQWDPQIVDAMAGLFDNSRSERTTKAHTA
ncbi:MAG TPA: HD-GYP domain-containing protein [Candidatus Baltobacteraceae bacterium]|nr:HD-GYP domain-containing protein [Candidatus Baltobacteraceae bacterium]